MRLVETFPAVVLEFWSDVWLLRKLIPCARSPSANPDVIYSCLLVRKLDEDFANAKKLLMLATKLVHPDPSAPIALRCDASKYALGAVLETFQGGQWLPLGFWSKHLPENKQRYSTFCRELAAIHLGMRHFKAETDGKHVIFTRIARISQNSLHILRYCMTNLNNKMSLVAWHNCFCLRLLTMIFSRHWMNFMFLA